MQRINYPNYTVAMYLLYKYCTNFLLNQIGFLGSINAAVGNLRFLSETSLAKTNFEQIFRESTPTNRETFITKVHPDRVNARITGMRVPS